LIGNSTGSAPHPIYRAVWLREAILGEEVKPPPAEVPALVDSAGAAAEKAVTSTSLHCPSTPPILGSTAASLSFTADRMATARRAAAAA
jgi:hypothetical protein